MSAQRIEGWLQRQTRSTKSWKHRYYFLFLDDRHDWILASSDSKPRKELNTSNYKTLCDEYFSVTGAQIGLEGVKSQHEFVITPMNDRGTYSMLATSIQERNLWLNALSHCGAVGWIVMDDDAKLQTNTQGDDSMDIDRTSFTFASGANTTRAREQELLYARSKTNSLRPAYTISKKKFSITPEQIALHQQQQQQQNMFSNTNSLGSLISAPNNTGLTSPTLPLNQNNNQTSSNAPNSTGNNRPQFNLLAAPPFLQPGSLQTFASPVPGVVNVHTPHSISHSQQHTFGSPTIGPNGSQISTISSPTLDKLGSNFSKQYNTPTITHVNPPIRSFQNNTQQPSLIAPDVFQQDDDNERDVMIMEGWIEKRPPAFFKQYRKRWAQLFSLPPRLLYFHTREEAYSFAEQQRAKQQNDVINSKDKLIVPLGVMHLYGAQLSAQDQSGEFTLNLAWGQNPVLINVKTKSVRAEWLRALIPLVAVSPSFLKQVIELSQNPIVIADIEQRSKEARKLLFDREGEILPEVTMDMVSFTKQFPLIPAEIIQVCPLIVTSLSSKVLLQKEIGRLWGLFIQQEQIQHQGDMLKEGKHGGQWKTRHCVLTNGVLLYFSTPAAVKQTEVSLAGSALYAIEHVMMDCDHDLNSDNFFQRKNLHGDTGTIGKLSQSGSQVYGPYGAAVVEREAPRGRDSLRLSGRINLGPPGMGGLLNQAPYSKTSTLGLPAGGLANSKNDGDGDGDGDDEPVNLRPLNTFSQTDFVDHDLKDDDIPPPPKDDDDDDHDHDHDDSDEDDDRGNSQITPLVSAFEMNEDRRKNFKTPEQIVDETFAPIYNPMLSNHPHMSYIKIRTLTMTTTWCWLQPDEQNVPLGFISLNNCKITFLTKSITPAAQLPWLPKDYPHCVQIVLGAKNVHQDVVRTFAFALKFFHEVKPWLAALALTTHVGFIRDDFNAGFWSSVTLLPSLLSHLSIPTTSTTLPKLVQAVSQSQFPLPIANKNGQYVMTNGCGVPLQQYQFYTPTSTLLPVLYDPTSSVPHPLPFAFTPLTHSLLQRSSLYLRPALTDVQFVTMLQASRFLQHIANEVLHLVNDGALYYNDGTALGGGSNGGFVRFPISSALRLLPRRDMPNIEGKLYDMLIKYEDRISYSKRMLELTHVKQSSLNPAITHVSHHLGPNMIAINTNKVIHDDASSVQSSSTGYSNSANSISGKDSKKGGSPSPSISTAELIPSPGGKTPLSTKPSKHRLYQDEFPDLSYTPATLSTTEHELFTLTDSFRDFLRSFSFSRAFFAYWAVQEEAYCDFAVASLANQQNIEVNSIVNKVLQFHANNNNAVNNPAAHVTESLSNQPFNPDSLYTSASAVQHNSHPFTLPQLNRPPVAASITQALSSAPLTAHVGFRHLLLWLQCEEFSNHIPGSLQQRYIAQRIYRTFLAPDATLPVSVDLALTEEISLRLLDPTSFSLSKGNTYHAVGPRFSQQVLLHEEAVSRELGILHYNSTLVPNHSNLTYERTSPHFLFNILSSVTSTKQTLPTSLFRQLQQSLHEMIAVDVYPSYLTKDSVNPGNGLGGEQSVTRFNAMFNKDGLLRADNPLVKSIHTAGRSNPVEDETFDKKFDKIEGSPIHQSSPMLGLTGVEHDLTGLVSPRDSLISSSSHISLGNTTTITNTVTIQEKITFNNNIHQLGSPTAVLPLLTDEILLRKLYSISTQNPTTATHPIKTTQHSTISSNMTSFRDSYQDSSLSSPTHFINPAELVQIQSELQHRMVTAIRDRHTSSPLFLLYPLFFNSHKDKTKLA